MAISATRKRREMPQAMDETSMSEKSRQNMIKSGAKEGNVKATNITGYLLLMLLIAAGCVENGSNNAKSPTGHPKKSENDVGPSVDEGKDPEATTTPEEETNPKETAIPGRPPGSGGGTFTMIASGQHHDCVLNTDGEIYCWGNNLFGQVGTGFPEDAHEDDIRVLLHRYVPENVSVPVIVYIGMKKEDEDIEVVRASTIQSYLDTSCIIEKKRDKVMCWGNNYSFQAGQKVAPQNRCPQRTAEEGADDPQTDVPVEPLTGYRLRECEMQSVLRPSRIFDTMADESRSRIKNYAAKKVILGGTYGCMIAVDKDSSDEEKKALLCWGSKIGNNCVRGKLVATAATSYTDGYHYKKYPNCVVLTDFLAEIGEPCAEDKLYTYGRKANGLRLPVEMANAASVAGKLAGRETSHIVAGEHDACAVLVEAENKRKIVCWGRSASRNSGGDTDVEADGFFAPVSYPAGKTLTSVRGMAMQSQRACVIDQAGDVLCWDWKRARSATPLKAGAQHSGRNVKSIALGAGHGCLLDQNGKILCWGSNKYGQLGVERGIGTDEVVTALVEVQKGENESDDGYDSVSAGDRHTCALTKNREEVYCWGAAWQLRDSVRESECAALCAKDRLNGRCIRDIEWNDEVLYVCVHDRPVRVSGFRENYDTKEECQKLCTKKALDTRATVSCKRDKGQGRWYCIQSDYIGLGG